MAWPTKTDFVDGDVLNASQMNNIGTNLNLANPTGITDGYVLTATGTGSMGWEAVPPGGGMTQIAAANLAGASTYTISSIPQTYKSLVLWLDSPGTGSNTQLYVQINGFTGSLYANKKLYYGTAANYIFTDTGFAVRYNNATGSPFAYVNFPNYASTTYKKTMFSHLCGGSGAVSEIGSCFYDSGTAAITSIRIYNISGNFSEGRYILYGVS